MAATQRQVEYAIGLLDRAGCSTGYMNAGFVSLGARMGERSATVRVLARGAWSATGSAASSPS